MPMSTSLAACFGKINNRDGVERQGLQAGRAQEQLWGRVRPGGAIYGAGETLPGVRQGRTCGLCLFSLCPRRTLSAHNPVTRAGVLGSQ